METAQLTLSIDDINNILNALGHQPYVQVFELINRIQVQVTQQLNAVNAKKEIVQ
jgi:hypothetical protein